MSFKFVKTSLETLKDRIDAVIANSLGNCVVYHMAPSDTEPKEKFSFIAKSATLKGIFIWKSLVVVGAVDGKPIQVTVKTPSYMIDDGNLYVVDTAVFGGPRVFA